MDAKSFKVIAQWAPELKGVFTLPDLRVALDENSEPTLYRRVAALVAEGALIKIKRGIYATPDASLATISGRIDPAAYISTGTVLAEKAVIGSIPARRVQAVKVGRPRTYRCELGTIEHLSVNSRLYFGFAADSEIRTASPEKAFLDVCYFLYCGRRFSFDPVTDVNLERLDFDLVERFLKAYGPRFATFFNRHWRRP
jgi:hypothetical protein